MSVCVNSSFHFYSNIHQLTEIVSITGLGHGMQELLRKLPTTGPSPHGCLHWMCWLLRQPSLTDCTLKHYWILLLPRQRASTNHNRAWELLLPRRRLKAGGALCGKVGETEKLFLGKVLLDSLVFFGSRCSSEEETMICRVYLFQGQCSVPLDTPGEYRG